METQPQKNGRKWGPIFIILAAFLWGLDGVLRRSLFSLPPILIVFYEHLIGALLILPFFLGTGIKEKFTRREWLALIWVAFLSGVLGTLWFTTALVRVNFISFSVVFLLQKLQPIFAIGMAIILLRERIHGRYLLWSGLAVLAAYFVTFPGGQVNWATGQGTIIAALFALGAAFAWGSSTAFSRYALLSHSQTTVTAWRFFLTVPLALITGTILGESMISTIPSSSQFKTLLLIALSTGMVALWIYYRGLRYTQTKIATVLELVFPLTAVLIDVFWYGHYLEPSQYFAGAGLVFAIYQVSKLNREPEL